MGSLASPPPMGSTPQSLHTATFVIVDTETTGSSAAYHQLTEIAALKVRGGEVLGHFRSLIWGASPTPGFIIALTGITDAMRRSAPDEADVVAAFGNFLGDAVVVGHNLGFDLGFLNAAMVRETGQVIGNQTIDTLRLARRLLRNEVENFKLATLARYLCLRPPSHRALCDVLATAALLDELIGRLGSYGVRTLGELEQFNGPLRSHRARSPAFISARQTPATQPTTPGLRR